MRVSAIASPEPALTYEDEINPFTGNLPMLRSGRENRRDVKPASNPLQAVPWPDAIVDEMNPFTGNLPLLPSQSAPETQGRLPAQPARSEPTDKSLVAKSGQQKPANYKLWAFIDHNRPRN